MNQTVTSTGTGLTFQMPPIYGEAFISLKRNRSKFYPGNQVFLQDKQEFEIELFNPTQTTKLAKITINGKFISNSGIVLKPGQRVYLERYIDNPQKFKFETYVIDGNDSQSVAAAANNGVVQVFFYDEYVPQIFWNTSNVFYSNTANGTITNTSGIGGSSCSTSNFSTGATGGQQVNSLKSKYMSNRPELKSRSRGIGGQSMESSSMDFMEQSEEKERAVETGRVEKGGYSNQNFINYNGQFNTYTTNIVSIKLLPFSQKPVEVSELVQYCVECGSKNKGGKYKFCPTCGNKF